MAEKLPVDQLEKIVNVSGEAINIVHKASNGGGIFSLLSIVDELSTLGTIKKEVVLAQIKDLDTQERKHLLALLKAKVSLEDKALEAKLESGADCLDEVVDFGFKCYADVLQIKTLVESRIEEGKKLVEKVKGLV